MIKCLIKERKSVDMPYGGTTPAQDAKIERCVTSVMPTLKQYKDPKVRKSHAIAICKSRIMKKEGMRKENISLPRWTNEFTVITEGIEEKIGQKDSIKIRGTMMKAVTSRNGRNYSAEELEKTKFSHDTLSLNHTENVQDIVGNFKPLWVNDGYDYEAIVQNTPYHPGIVQMIEKGLIKHVSIEAIAGWIEKDGENYKVGDLDVTGLGLVKTPGIAETSVVIAEAFNARNDLAEKTKLNQLRNIKKESNMAEEEQEQPEEPKEETEKKPEEKPEEKEEKDEEKPSEPEKPAEQPSEAKIDKLTEQVSKLTDTVGKLIETKEKKESKGIVTETKSPFGENLLKESRKDGKGVDISCKYPDKLY